MIDLSNIVNSKTLLSTFDTSSICRNCNNQWACCIEIELPELTKVDLQGIKSCYPTQYDQFFKNHPYYPTRSLKTLIQSRSLTCPFFNINSHTCDIYPRRPLLCRLFPLDIYYDRGEYFWILYHKFCALSSLMRGKIQAIVLNQVEKQVLPCFSHDELILYSTKAIRQFSLFKKGEWEKIRKVQYYDNALCPSIKGE